MKIYIRPVWKKPRTSSLHCTFMWLFHLILMNVTKPDKKFAGQKAGQQVQ